MLFRKVQKSQQNTNEQVPAKKRRVFKVFLSGVTSVYSHDSLSRFWSNHSGNQVNQTK